MQRPTVGTGGTTNVCSDNSPTASGVTAADEEIDLKG